MKKISLNDIDKSRNNDNGEYQLDPTEKYVINLEEELQFQTAIMTSFHYGSSASVEELSCVVI